MDIIFKEFERDLERVCDQLKLIDALKEFAALAPLDEDINTTEFARNSSRIHELSRSVHKELPILTGTLALYIAGRFEEYSRTLFEDLCERLVQKAPNFKALPKKMQQGLIEFTAMVVQAPRKYGFGEGAVASFIATLHENLSNPHVITAVNQQCLSITEANMRSEMLRDLFDRIGATKLWEKIGQQAPIQAHFGTSDPSQAQKLAEDELNELMKLRNLVAHPSGGITWPSTDSIRNYTRYLCVLGKALYDLTLVFEGALCRPQEV